MSATFAFAVLDLLGPLLRFAGDRLLIFISECYEENLMEDSTSKSMKKNLYEHGSQNAVKKQ